MNVPYLGVTGEFLYNGKVTTAEDFGNINYGFIGSLLGFEEEILYMGGGYAAHKSIPKILLDPPFYGDSVNDHFSIKRGIDMYYGRGN